MSLASGERLAPEGAAEGEAALLVLKGAARLRDESTSAVLDGGEGCWWYIEPGTRWSVENARADTKAELLLIRAAGGQQA